MTAFDYVLDIVLILLVALQLRPSRFGARAILLPLATVGTAAAVFLRSFPTTGGDLPLVIALTAVGAALGVASGLTTRVWRDASRGVLVQAGFAAAALWLVGMVGRAVFQFWADGAGQAEIGKLSMQWHISGAAPWVAALVLMALAEVIARIAVLSVRAARARRAASAPAPTAAARATVAI
jgi:hypothetical protein